MSKLQLGFSGSQCSLSSTGVSWSCATHLPWTVCNRNRWCKINQCSLPWKRDLNTKLHTRLVRRGPQLLEWRSWCEVFSIRWGHQKFQRAFCLCSWESVFFLNGNRLFLVLVQQPSSFCLFLLLFRLWLRMALFWFEHLNRPVVCSLK